MNTPLDMVSVAARIATDPLVQVIIIIMVTAYMFNFVVRLGQTIRHSAELDARDMEETERELDYIAQWVAEEPEKPKRKFVLGDDGEIHLEDES